MVVAFHLTTTQNFALTENVGRTTGRSPGAAISGIHDGFETVGRRQPLPTASAAAMLHVAHPPPPPSPARLGKQQLRLRLGQQGRRPHGQSARPTGFPTPSSAATPSSNIEKIHRIQNLRN